MRDIDGKSHVASPRILELAHQEVHHPRLIQAIDNANQRIMDFLAENEHQEVVAPKAGSPASLRVPEEELKDINDGKALFEHIIAPFGDMSSMWMYGVHGVVLAVVKWSMYPP